MFNWMDDDKKEIDEANKPDPIDLQPQPARFTDEQLNREIREAELGQKEMKEYSNDDINFLVSQEEARQKTGYDKQGKRITPKKETEGSMVGIGAMQTYAPGFAKDAVKGLWNDMTGQDGDRPVGDITEPDENLMRDFNDLVRSGKYETYDEMRHAMANLGYNPARVTQLTEFQADSESPYWDKYRGDGAIDQMENGFAKTYFGGKSLVTKLEPWEDEMLDKAQAQSKSYKEVGGLSPYVMELAPEMAAGAKVFTTMGQVGKAGIYSAAIANAFSQGSLTAGAVHGETDNKVEAMAWGTGIAAVSGLMTLMPLIPSVVEHNALKYIKALGVDERQLDEMVETLGAVEELQGLSVAQRKVLAVAKLHPEGASAIREAVEGSSEARRNFVDTMIKKEEAANLGIVHKTRDQWNDFYTNLIKAEDAHYTSVQKSIKDKLGNASIDSKELGIPDSLLKFNDKLMEKWPTASVDTMNKIRAGEEVSLGEMQALRRVTSQQSGILNEEGAKELGHAFRELTGIIDGQAIPKILEANILPEQAVVIGETYDKAVKGYAQMNNMKRSMIGKIVFEGKATDDAIFNVIRKSFLSKGTDGKTDMSQFIKMFDDLGPELKPLAEQAVLRDLVKSHGTQISGTNKAQMTDWAKLAIDLEDIPMSSFTTDEGKSAYVVIKKLADVAQTELATTRTIFGGMTTSDTAQMGRNALGFNTKLIAMKKAWSESIKYFNDPAAFTSTLTKALEVKGSNLSETLYSMKNAGIFPKSKGGKTAFNNAMKHARIYQEEVDKQHNMLFMKENTDGAPIKVGGTEFNGMSEMVNSGALKITNGDIVPTNIDGGTALIINDDVSIRNIGKLARVKEGDSLPLDEVIKGTKLYEEYPWLKNVKVIPYKQLDGSPMPVSNLGAVNVKHKVIMMNMVPGAVTNDFVGTLMHEVGHLINNVNGVPGSAGMEAINVIVNRKFGGDMDAFLKSVKAPKDVVGPAQAYTKHTDEQFADMNVKGGGEVDFKYGEMSDNISDELDSLLPNEREYLEGKGLNVSPREVENASATPIKLTQKMERLLDELPQDRKMTGEQLKGWLGKQGVTEHELEVSGMNMMGEGDWFGGKAATIGNFRTSMKTMFNDRHKIESHNLGPDDVYNYEKISYKQGGVNDPEFEVKTQTIGLKETQGYSDSMPTTHQFSGEDPTRAEVGHSRMGVQKIGGKDTTVIHEIQADWAQNARQRGQPFEKDIDAFLAKKDELEQLEAKYHSNTKTNPMTDKEHDRYEELKDFMHKNEGDFDGSFKRNDELPYGSSWFDWIEGIDDGKVTMHNSENGERWMKSKDGKSWEIHGDTSVPYSEVNKKNYPDIPVETKTMGIMNYPTTQKKYTQWQTVEGINKAIENGTNRVVIPLDRQFADLAGNTNINKAYENMEKPIKELVKKLQKQGMDIEFNRIIDKGTGFKAKPQELKFIREEVREMLGGELEYISQRHGLEDLDKALEKLDSDKFIEAYQKVKDGDFFSANPETENLLDLYNSLTEGKDRRLMEIKINGKKPGSKQSWDMMSMLGAVGLGAAASNTKAEANEDKFRGGYTGNEDPDLVWEKVSNGYSVEDAEKEVKRENKEFEEMSKTHNIKYGVPGGHKWVKRTKPRDTNIKIKYGVRGNDKNSNDEK